MKNMLYSIVMTFSMFSSIPMPQIPWKQENMRYLLSFLPLVGVVTGAGLLLWDWVCRVVGLGQLLYAVGLTLIPVLISGGIHMDGFCDTMDALSSHASPEKKREILKDPRAGAFAVIFCGVYLLAYFGFATELTMGARTALILLLIHSLARCFGAFAGMMFPGSKSTGLLAGFRDAATKKALVALLVLAAILVLLLGVVSTRLAALLFLTGTLLTLWLRHMANREFGGMSGDLAGFLITLTELTMLAVFVLAGKVGAL